MAAIEVLDANVLIQFLINDDERHGQATRAYFDAIILEQREAILPVVTLTEVIHVPPGRRYRLGPVELAEVLRAVLSLPLILLDRDVVEKALELFDEIRVEWEDCLVAAYAIVCDAGTVVTFDGDFQQIAGVSLVDPLQFPGTLGHPA